MSAPPARNRATPVIRATSPQTPPTPLRTLDPMNSKELCERVLSAADVKVNGDRPWDIRVHNGDFYDRVLGQGTLGLGESYMDAWWDCDALDEMMARSLKAGGEKALSRNWVNAVQVLKAKFFNPQTRRGARKVAEQHYDIDDRLYMSFLDPYNQYTCGYFKNADKHDLERAQQDKMDLIRILPFASIDYNNNKVITNNVWNFFKILFKITNICE